MVWFTGTGSVTKWLPVAIRKKVHGNRVLFGYRVSQWLGEYAKIDPDETVDGCPSWNELLDVLCTAYRVKAGCYEYEMHRFSPEWVIIEHERMIGMDRSESEDPIDLYDNRHDDVEQMWGSVKLYFQFEEEKIQMEIEVICTLHAFESPDGGFGNVDEKEVQQMVDLLNTEESAHVSMYPTVTRILKL